MAVRSILDAARASLEIEVIRAERMEARARYGVTLAAVWFALVQAVVTVGLKMGMTPAWEITLGATALAATLVLATATWRLSGVWRLAPNATVTHDALADVAATLRANPEPRADALLDDFEHLIHYAQARNEVRMAALKRADAWWWLALAGALAELSLALAARLATV